MILSFLAGGLIGSLATYYILKKKNKNEKEKEISDVINYYSEQLRSAMLECGEEPNDDLPTDYPKEDISPEDKPYPITQQEYVEDADFDKQTVVYYSVDNVLADMYDNEMTINDTIGEEVLDNFEEDLAYARNPKLGIDYEVCLEKKSYSVVVGEDMEE